MSIPLWAERLSKPASRVGPMADDAKIVAALDTEYQAAVKNNDVETMDRILADDFVLITGLGKTYTKADLLAEARSKRMVYERQEDSDQKVRLWGDTAVVTALLWAKGSEAGKPFEYQTLVQRHLCKNARRLALCFCPGVDPPARHAGGPGKLHRPVGELL